LTNEEQFKKIKEIWSKINLDAPDVDKKIEELDTYLQGIADSTADQDEGIWWSQIQLFINIIQRINKLRIQTNERMDNFVITTKGISDRLLKLESEISLLKKYQQKKGLE